MSVKYDAGLLKANEQTVKRYFEREKPANLSYGKFTPTQEKLDGVALHMDSNAAYKYYLKLRDEHADVHMLLPFEIINVNPHELTPEEKQVVEEFRLNPRTSTKYDSPVFYASERIGYTFQNYYKSNATTLFNDEYNIDLRRIYTRETWEQTMSLEIRMLIERAINYRMRLESNHLRYCEKHPKAEKNMTAHLKITTYKTVDLGKFEFYYDLLDKVRTLLL